MNRELEGLVALVTGAGNGIGHRKSIENMHAQKRLGNSQEVAAAVTFLASSRASFITRHPLLVDGGFVSM